MDLGLTQQVAKDIWYWEPSWLLNLVTSWEVLENNPLPAHCWTSIIPYHILNLILVPTDKSSYCLSSKKSLFTAYGTVTENYNSGCNAEISGLVGSPNGYTCITVPESIVRECSGRECGK